MRLRWQHAAVWTVVGSSCLTASCGSEKTAGSVTLAISTDMRAPKDVDAVGLYVWQDGKPAFQHIEAVRADGTIQFPSTFVVAATNAALPRIRVRLIAFQRQGAGGRSARVIRDALTTVPKTRAALLRMPLRWINTLDSAKNPALSDELVVTCQGGCTGASLTSHRAKLRPRDTESNPYDIDKVLERDNGCPLGSNQTLDDEGNCTSAEIDESNLPDYREEEVFGGGRSDGQGNVVGGTCFDVPNCFSTQRGGTVRELTPDELTSCSLPEPAGAQSINVALRVADDRGGHVGENGSFLPLDDTQWSRSLRGDAKEIAIDPVFCQLVRSGRALGIRVAFDVPRCSTKTASEPVCSPASSVRTANTKEPVPDEDPPIAPRDAGSDVPSEEPVDAETDAGLDAGKDPDARGDATLPDGGAGEDAEAGDATLPDGGAGKDAEAGANEDGGDAGVSDAASDGDAEEDGGSKDGGLGGYPSRALHILVVEEGLEGLANHESFVAVSKVSGSSGCDVERLPILSASPWFGLASPSRTPSSSPDTCTLSAMKGKIALFGVQSFPEPAFVYGLLPTALQKLLDVPTDGGVPYLTGDFAVMGDGPAQPETLLSSTGGMLRSQFVGGMAPTAPGVDVRVPGSNGMVRSGFLMLAPTGQPEAGPGQAEAGFAFVKSAADELDSNVIWWCPRDAVKTCTRLGEVPFDTRVSLATPLFDPQNPEVGLAILLLDRDVRVLYLTKVPPPGTTPTLPVPIVSSLAPRGLELASIATDGEEIYWSLDGSISVVSAHGQRGPEALWPVHADAGVNDSVKALSAWKSPLSATDRAVFFLDSEGLKAIRFGAVPDLDGGSEPDGGSELDAGGLPQN